MRYALVDVSTGAVRWFGDCLTTDLGLQAKDGQLAADVSTLGLGRGNGDYWYDGATVAARVALAYTAPDTATVGAAITLTAPPGAAVSIDGEAVGTIDGTGSTPITFSDAGTYAIGLSLWPYLDAAFEIVAS